MKKLNQSGIAHLAAIIIVLLIAGVGFAGWRVYESSKDKPQQSSTVLEEKDEDVEEEETSTIPEGFVEYENKELGFKFAHPKEWGEVELKKTIGDNKSIRGTNVSISFTKSSQPAATLRSRDYKILEGGRGGAYWDAPTEFKLRKEIVDGLEIVSGVIVENSAWNADLGSVQKILIDEENLKAKASCDDFTASVAMYAYPYLKSNKTFDTGNFYFLIRGPKSDGSGVDLAGCDNIDNLIRKDKDTFLMFARTIQAT